MYADEWPIMLPKFFSLKKIITVDSWLGNTFGKPRRGCISNEHETSLRGLFPAAGDYFHTSTNFVWALAVSKNKKWDLGSSFSTPGNTHPVITTSNPHGRGCILLLHSHPPATLSHPLRNWQQISCNVLALETHNAVVNPSWHDIIGMTPRSWVPIVRNSL